MRKAPIGFPDNRKSKIQNRKWAGCLALVVILAGWMGMAEAQEAEKVYRVGYLHGAQMPASYFEAFKDGLREHGYVSGKNIIIEYRPTSGRKQRAEFIEELVRQRVDVIVTTGTGAIRAAMKATKVIPIIMSPSADAVKGGLVASLSRPGGNVTGLTMTSPDLAGKRLQILKEALPGVTRVVAVFPVGSRSTALPPWLEATEAQAKKLNLAFAKLGLKFAKGRKPAAWEPAFEAAAQKSGSALVVIENSRFIANRTKMAELAARYRLPTMFSIKEHVESGGLISYGPDLVHVQRRAAAYVEKIFKGANPAELPVEQPRKFELVINLKTAGRIGVTIPPTVLYQATEVIK